MKYTHEDQVSFARIALQLFDNERTNPQAIEQILDFGELIKKHSDENNAIIFDITEYLYEQLRLIQGEHGAFDDVELRRKIEKDIRSH